MVEKTKTALKRKAELKLYVPWANYLIIPAWNLVNSDTIAYCFIKAMFHLTSHKNVEEDLTDEAWHNLRKPGNHIQRLCKL
jgi:hypothetical protein